LAVPGKSTRCGVLFLACTVMLVLESDREGKYKRERGGVKEGIILEEDAENINFEISRMVRGLEEVRSVRLHRTGESGGKLFPVLQDPVRHLLLHVGDVTCRQGQLVCHGTELTGGAEERGREEREGERVRE